MEPGDIKLRPITELDFEAVTAIDEKITGTYRPKDWEGRVAYYIRRDPELSLVAEMDGQVVGFMLGEVKAGEFGLEEKSGWIEVMGVDPKYQGHRVGARLMEGLLGNFRDRGAKAVRTLINEETQADLGKFFQASGFESTPIRTLERPLQT